MIDDCNNVTPMPKRLEMDTFLYFLSYTSPKLPDPEKLFALHLSISVTL